MNLFDRGGIVCLVDRFLEGGLLFGGQRLTEEVEGLVDPAGLRLERLGGDFGNDRQLIGRGGQRNEQQKRGGESEAAQHDILPKGM